LHALDLAGLCVPEIQFFSARGADGALLGVGALKRLDATHAELKSMHTAVAARGQGVGRAIVAHLLATARAAGFSRVSLETGSMAAYVPARTLYATFGFTPCPPFGSYRDSPNSVCMTLTL
jgi:putative acetyltransferase